MCRKGTCIGSGGWWSSSLGLVKVLRVVALEGDGLDLRIREDHHEKVVYGLKESRLSATELFLVNDVLHLSPECYISGWPNPLLSP
jgi:hypothetical protein